MTKRPRAGRSAIPREKRALKVRTLKGHRGNIMRVGLLPDGRVATASEDGDVRVFGRGEKVTEGRVIRTHAGFGGVLGLEVLPGGYLVSGGHDGVAVCRGDGKVVGDWSCIQRVGSRQRVISAIASLGGDRFAAAVDVSDMEVEGEIVWFKGPKCEVAESAPTGHSHVINDLAACGNMLASASADGRIVVWDGLKRVASVQVVPVKSSDNNKALYAIGLCKEYCVVGGRAGKVWVYRVGEWDKPMAVFSDGGAPVNKLRCFGGGYFGFTTRNGYFWVLDARLGKDCWVKGKIKVVNDRMALFDFLPVGGGTSHVLFSTGPEDNGDSLFHAYHCDTHPSFRPAYMGKDMDTDGPAEKKEQSGRESHFPPPEKKRKITKGGRKKSRFADLKSVHDDDDDEVLSEAVTDFREGVEADVEEVEDSGRVPDADDGEWAPEAELINLQEESESGLSDGALGSLVWRQQAPQSDSPAEREGEGDNIRRSGRQRERLAKQQKKRTRQEEKRRRQQAKGAQLQGKRGIGSGDGNFVLVDDGVPVGRVTETMAVSEYPEVESRVFGEMAAGSATDLLAAKELAAEPLAADAMAAEPVLAEDTLPPLDLLDSNDDGGFLTGFGQAFPPPPTPFLDSVMPDDGIGDHAPARTLGGDGHSFSQEVMTDWSPAVGDDQDVVLTDPQLNVVLAREDPKDVVAIDPSAVGEEDVREGQSCAREAPAVGLFVTQGAADTRGGGDVGRFAWEKDEIGRVDPVAPEKESMPFSRLERLPLPAKPRKQAVDNEGSPVSTMSTPTAEDVSRLDGASALKPQVSASRSPGPILPIFGAAARRLGKASGGELATFPLPAKSICVDIADTLASKAEALAGTLTYINAAAFAAKFAGSGTSCGVNVPPETMVYDAVVLPGVNVSPAVVQDLEKHRGCTSTVTNNMVVGDGSASGTQARKGVFSPRAGSEGELCIPLCRPLSNSLTVSVPTALVVAIAPPCVDQQPQDGAASTAQSEEMDFIDLSSHKVVATRPISGQTLVQMPGGQLPQDNHGSSHAAELLSLAAAETSGVVIPDRSQRGLASWIAAFLVGFDHERFVEFWEVKTVLLVGCKGAGVDGRHLLTKSFDESSFMGLFMKILEGDQSCLPRCFGYRNILSDGLKRYRTLSDQAASPS